jgi:DNA-binding XRE family transcriptional regulator
MPNIASALKAEIQRIARRTIRDETISVKKAIAAYRSEIAELKRRSQVLEQQLRRSQKTVSRTAAPPRPEEDQPSGLRFSAKGLAAHRQRLGLSAQDFGALIGASALSVYKWEKGEVRPRARYLDAIAAIRSIGKKEAAARLASSEG